MNIPVEYLMHQIPNPFDYPQLTKNRRKHYPFINICELDNR